MIVTHTFDAELGHGRDKNKNNLGSNRVRCTPSSDSVHSFYAHARHGMDEHNNIPLQVQGMGATLLQISFDTSGKDDFMSIPPQRLAF